MNKKILFASAAAILGIAGLFGVIATQNQGKKSIPVVQEPLAQQNTKLTTATVDKPRNEEKTENTVASDLFSAGSINAQMPWAEGDVNATAKALDQAAKVVSVAPKFEFVDSAKKISIKLPTAWEARSMPSTKDKSIVSNFIIEGPGAPPPTCVFTGVKSENTAKITQAKINDVMHTEKAITGMKKAISGSGAKLLAVNKITIDSSNALQLIIQPKVAKTAPDLTTALIVLEQPGLRWQIACSSYSAEYDQIKPEYETLLKSISWVK